MDLESDDTKQKKSIFKTDDGFSFFPSLFLSAGILIVRVEYPDTLS